MTPKHANWTRLSDPIERATARLATIARQDTVHGGASALIIAKDGWYEDVCGNKTEDIPKEIDTNAIVSSVYSASTGKPSEQYEAWECPECGQVHLGIKAALKCCGEEGE